MQRNIACLITTAAVMAGCATYDGGYSPSCPTFVANVVQLEDGQFTWTKISDEVVIDEQGNPVNRFPGYPLKGSYKVRGGALLMTSAAGETLPPMYPHRDGEQLYLLTGVEHNEVQSGGELPDCALRRASEADEN